MTDAGALRSAAAADRLAAALAARYAIEREVGRGGMAVVYLARDLRHNRRVALKVLNPELGAVLGPERFLAEIQVTANLQHPHLLPLFDSGEADGQLFYVMPYVEGETLRSRIGREKQLTVDEAVRVAVAIANALDYAHRNGVIHRDLKPDNILLEEGEPVLADFGIALAISNAGGERVTQTGLSLGTPQYMSPEQATGDRVVDGRSDIYALSAVLYEMLVGDAPHMGSTAQIIIAKVISERPINVRVLRPAVPEHVAAAIEKGLEKFPADRWSTARDFADALKAGVTTLRTASAPAGVPPRARRRWLASSLPWLAVLALAVTAALWSWSAARPDAPRSAVRFPLTLAPNERIATTMGSTVAISPDGKIIAYSGMGSGGIQQLFRRALDDIRARPIAGTEDGERPFFSPDGAWVGFLANGQLRKVPINGGAAIALPEVSLVNGAAWGRNDVIVISAQNRLTTLPANGGPSRPISVLDSASGETSQRWPHLLADGKTVLYTSWRTSVADARIAVASLPTGKTTILNVAGTFPLGVLDGQLIYATASGTLEAVPFDARRILVRGTPKVVVDNLVVDTDGAAKAELSPSGSLIYQVGRTMLQIALADRNGEMHVVIGEPRRYEFPRFSPDGTRIALTVTTDTATDVWTYDVASARLTRLATGGTVNDRPEWSPDGKRVIFASNRGGGYALWWQPADGSGTAEPLLTVPGTDIMEGVLSPDGTMLVYRTGKQDIWYRRLDGDSTPHPIATTRFAEYGPRLSPDGRWVAHSSDESGVTQVYVRPFPSLGARYQISVDGGSEPVWSADGRRLYYRRNRLVKAATLATGTAFAVTSREELFEGDFIFQFVHAEYDASRDGKRFLVLKSAGSDVQTIVVRDWLYELRARAAASR
jgi:eukaryotic-like serine/threonine-protein kinase